MFRKSVRRECGNSAARAFLQTACGVLTAAAAAAVTGIVPPAAGWKTALLTLTASAASAGVAAVIALCAECGE